LNGSQTAEAKLFDGSGGCSRSLGNHSFSASVNPLDGGQVKGPKKVGALLQITCKLGEKDVSGESYFNRLRIEMK
jgi:hypothetical protein